MPALMSRIIVYCANAPPCS